MAQPLASLLLLMMMMMKMILMMMMLLSTTAEVSVQQEMKLILLGCRNRPCWAE